jgi:hypothetical protein
MNDDVAVLHVRPSNRSALVRTLIAILLIAAAFAGGLATGRALDRGSAPPPAARIDPAPAYVPTGSLVTGTGPDLIVVADQWRAAAAQEQPPVTGTGPGLVLVANGG